MPDFGLPTRQSVLPQALEQFTIEKDIAAYIKKEFDKKHEPTWHCIVGRHFGGSLACALACWIQLPSTFNTSDLGKKKEAIWLEGLRRPTLPHPVLTFLGFLPMVIVRLHAYVRQASIHMLSS